MPGLQRRPTPSAAVTRAEAMFVAPTSTTPLERAYALYRWALNEYFHGRATIAAVGEARKLYRIEASREVDRHAHDLKPWEGLHTYDVNGYAVKTSTIRKE